MSTGYALSDDERNRSEAMLLGERTLLIPPPEQAGIPLRGQYTSGELEGLRALLENGWRLYPDGAQLRVSGRDGGVEFWRVQRGVPIREEA